MKLLAQPQSRVVRAAAARRLSEELRIIYTLEYDGSRRIYFLRRYEIYSNYTVQQLSSETII